jgi:hypothetical protein
MIWLKNATDYRRVPFSELKGFLKISTSLYTGLAAETRVADGDLFTSNSKQGGFAEIRGRTRIPVIFKELGHILNLDKRK